MVETWRLLDTGLASATRNVALDRALLEARAADEAPGTLRFMRYTPSVLLGCRQSAAQELHLAACAAQALALQRRLTGGGARLVDERQLGWALYLHRRDVACAGAQDLVRRVGHALATALTALGMAARFRPRGDIAVEGRTLCTLTHAADGEALLIQGVLFGSLDYDALARVLRVPGGLEGAASAEALRERMTDLREALGGRPDLAAVRRNLVEAFESAFDVELREGDLGLSENARYARAGAEIDTAGWANLVCGASADMVYAEAQPRTGAGVLRIGLKYERASRVLRQVWFSGVPAMTDPELRDLEAVLADCASERLGRTLERFFTERGGVPPGLDCAGVLAAIRLALGEPLAA